MNEPSPLPKEACRRRMEARRRALSPPEVRAASAAVADRLRTLPEWAGARVVLGYAAFRNEIDIRDFLEELLRRGGMPVLPAWDDARKAYVPVRLEAWEQLRPSRRGLLEPEPGAGLEVPPAEIEAAAVPGVAFDRHGTRLGRGGGHFDRLLAAVRGFRVGVAYDWQLVDRLAACPHDVPMHAVVTDRRIVRYPAIPGDPGEPDSHTGGDA